MVVERESGMSMLDWLAKLVPAREEESRIAERLFDEERQLIARGEFPLLAPPPAGNEDAGR